MDGGSRNPQFNRMDTPAALGWEGLGSPIVAMSSGTMTGARQPEKPRRWRGIGAILALAAACGALSGAKGAEEPKIVVNAATGLALSGVDPVAYFADGKPVFGSADLELTRFGTVWRFRNEGNRAAFVQSPEIYLPQFGGYDPVAILRGRAVPGHPLIWAVKNERLYLFYDDADRAAFLADPERIAATASRRWPALEQTLGR